MSNNRNYNDPDVDMLMASQTISESFKSNIAELSAVRTDWSEQYADGLKVKIDTAIEVHLGLDPKKDLRNATSSLSAVQIPAKRDISFFKTQIDDDFKNETSKRTEILKSLGFAKYLRGVQKGNQEALIQLLYTFKTNMTDSLRQEIAAKGINPSLIDKIIGYADTFKQANVTQEGFKGTTKEITKEMADDFNGIYAEIIGICKKAASYYQFEPLKKEQFTFAKVISNLGATRKVAEKTATNPAA